MNNSIIKFITPSQLILLLVLTATISCCNKDDDNPPPDPVGQLPPATQTGAGTFGCLLDGEVFLPGNVPNKLDCVYQFVNGGYYFSLQGSKRDSNNNVILIGLSTKNMEINASTTYMLKENIDQSAYGTYFFNTDFNYTNQIETGELKITKLDFDNHIVAGTFWFDVKDSNGIVHKIRDGRFDVRFTE